jgi:hypothetical protein
MLSGLHMFPIGIKGHADRWKSSIKGRAEGSQHGDRAQRTEGAERRLARAIGLYP